MAEWQQVWVEKIHSRVGIMGGSLKSLTPDLYRSQVITKSVHILLEYLIRLLYILYPIVLC
jgi:hypothetical protein